MIHGGNDEERLYLKDCFPLKIKRSDFPDMDNVVARHKGRYHLGAFLARPGMVVLDFPCGSGYGSEILGGITDLVYHGLDRDPVAIEYARLNYKGIFDLDDLTNPRKLSPPYDLILCIEGLEHVERDHHNAIIKKFADSLSPDGTLIVSMPEAPEESGPSKHNRYHLSELTFNDFVMLVFEHFNEVQMLTVKDVLHNGQKAVCMYAIARRG